LSCGLIAIFLAFQSQLVLAGLFIVIGLFFDFFDGMLARIFKVSGELGKQLDSLADLISFGVAPSIIVFQLIYKVETSDFLMQSDETNNLFLHWSPFIAFLIPIFSALRLAKFNIDTNQTSSFIGIPTPANAMFFIALPLILEYQESSFMAAYINNLYFLIIATFVMSLLMVAEIKLFSFKLKSFAWKENIVQYLFILISGLLLWLFHFVAIPIIILLYPVISLIKKQDEIQS
jgi:CDP-diacylglycerol--serine O-phosphatidyltransferase